MRRLALDSGNGLDRLVDDLTQGREVTEVRGDGARGLVAKEITLLGLRVARLSADARRGDVTCLSAAQ
jgi:hypothetical protein